MDNVRYWVASMQSCADPQRLHLRLTSLHNGFPQTSTLSTRSPLHTGESSVRHHIGRPTDLTALCMHVIHRNGRFTAHGQAVSKTQNVSLRTGPQAPVRPSSRSNRGAHGDQKAVHHRVYQHEIVKRQAAIFTQPLKYQYVTTKTIPTK